MKNFHLPSELFRTPCGRDPCKSPGSTDVSPSPDQNVYQMEKGEGIRLGGVTGRESRPTLKIFSRSFRPYHVIHTHYIRRAITFFQIEDVLVRAGTDPRKELKGAVPPSAPLAFSMR